MRSSRKNNVYLKTSVSRKNLNTIGIRQRQKIRSEIKRNYIKFVQSKMFEESMQNITDLIEKEHYQEEFISISSSQICTPINTNVTLNTNVILNTNVTLNTNMISSEVPENTNVNNANVDNIIRTNDNDNIECIKEKLIECFIRCDLNHRQIESILSVLRNHKCFINLPKNARTLLQTTRKQISLRKISSGVYLHIGFEEALINILQNVPTKIIPDKLLIDISTDGASEDRNGRIQIWPLQCIYTT